MPITTTTLLKDYPENELIYVHMVAHSHDDVGWLMTAEEYYQSQVVNILNSVILALLENSERKFSWTEIFYFKRWWNEQT